MNIRTPRVGALAPAVLLLFISFFAETSAARAQDQAPPPPAALSPFTPSASTPQFFAEEVVQPLADERAFGTADAARDRQAASLQQLVGDMPLEADLTSELKCLAQAVYFESRGEPLAGQLAVARVVINRAGSGLYPGSYCSVVTQRAQFSFVRHGRIPQPDETSPAWQRATAVAQIAHQDLWESEAGDALYFHATYVKPGWARRKTQLARIDTHVFYR